MREILFRGKRKDTGEWVEGDLVRLKDGTKAIPHIYGYGEVIPDTVGQFTGLTDRNRKKIFEGDICRFYGDEGHSDYVAFWDDNTSQWTVCQIDLGARDVLDSYFTECCEVIGNIHDNPELLGGGNDG